MNTSLGIASVTYVLRNFLNVELNIPEISASIGGSIDVTTFPPDRIELISHGQRQLNLYMYSLSTNRVWDNVNLPPVKDQEERMPRSHLSLDLHYLLTSYGENEFHTQILLGYAMRLLEENPVLNSELIHKSLNPSSLANEKGLPESLKTLSTSDLEELTKQVKIMHESLNAGEIATLWTVFGAKYRPTVAYQVSSILI